MLILRKISLIILLCFSALIFSSCGGDSRPVLKVYNAGKYIDPTVIEEFEQLHNCRVVYDEFDSNESMCVQIANNTYTYDIVVPSDYYIDRLIQEGRAEKLDKSKMPNVANLDTQYLNPVYDPGNIYSVPYMVGTIGILYNKAKTGVEEKDVTFGMLFDKKYKGQIFMLDSVRDALGVALIHLGYSVNSTSTKELNEAKNLLINQKPLVQAYITDEMVDKMVAGEGLLTLAYSGEAAYALSLDENDELSYAVPKEGSNKWVDGFVVLKTGKQKDLAMKFIDFMCSQDIAQRNMIETGYVSPVLGTEPEEESDTEVYYPKAETLANCEAFTYSAKVIEKYSDIWLSVQLSN